MSQPELLTKLFENDGAGPNLRSDIIPQVESDSSGERWDDIFFGGDFEVIDNVIWGVSKTLLVPPNARLIRLCYVDICRNIGYYPAESVPADELSFGIYPVGDTPQTEYWSFVTDTGYPGVDDGEHFILYANLNVWDQSSLPDGVEGNQDDIAYTLKTDGLFPCRGKASRIVWGYSSSSPNSGSSLRVTEHVYARLYYD